MDTNEEIENVGLFTKSKVSVAHDAKTAAHAAWHQKVLAAGRRRELFDKSTAQLAAAQAALEAKAALPSDAETGEFADLAAERAEVARLQDVVSRRRREAEAAEAAVGPAKRALDEASAALAEEEFNVEVLAPMEKALLALHEINQRVAKAQAQLPGRPIFSLQWLDEELVAAWVREKTARCNPVPRRAIDPMTAVKFLRATSGITGNRDGRFYAVGDGASFAPEIAASLVAQGAAEWLLPCAENAEATKRARRALAVPHDSDGPSAEATFTNG